MPASYTKMRDAIAKGAKVDSPAYNRAQSIAAAYYNKHHPGHPISNSRNEALKRALGGKKHA